jgi:hypothetical protein
MTNQEQPGYEYIQYGPGFSEIIFKNFKRSTLDAWLAGVEERYPELRDAPRLLTLYDLRAMLTFTPYAAAAFQKVIRREYKGTGHRLAFVIRENLINLRLRYAIERYRGGSGTARVFFNREQALEWLKEGMLAPVQAPEPEIQNPR